MFVRIHVQALCAALVLFGGPPAFAVCIPTHVYEVYVGDTASDSACTYNSIQAALDATYTCPTTVRITREHLWTSQHLSVSNRNLTLQGEADGVTCFQMANCIPAGGCHADTTTPLVTLDGNNSQGQSSGRVLDITGNSNITLRDLTIEHGVLDSSGHGGGISFSGSGSLTLDTTTVVSNSAGYGGGVSINGSGGNATLTLKANTQVISNTALYGGGGILASGSARLLALQSPQLIGFNHVPNGYGGGIEVIGPARADIGAHSTNGAAAVYFNDAQYGGGIAVSAGQDDQLDATVRLFSTDAQSAVQVADNFASHTGGGIYLKPYQGLGSSAEAVLCAQDFRIEDNAAQEGSAIYADEDNSIAGVYLGASAYLNSDDPVYHVCGTPEAPSALGAVPCAAGVACNAISGNAAQDGNGQPTDGSAILVQTGGYLDADRVRLDGNQGAHVARGVDGGLFLRNCLIAANPTSGELLYQSGGDNDPNLVLDSCTLAHDAIGAAAVVHGGAQSNVSLTDTIIDEPAVPTLDFAGSNLAVDYVLSNDTSTLPVAPGVVQGEPDFVDAANGDYHLLATSLGVDFAPPVSGDDRDLDGLPHDQDLPGVPNVYGDRDLGAYEIQLGALACGAADTIFCDGFESP